MGRHSKTQLSPQTESLIALYCRGVTYPSSKSWNYIAFLVKKKGGNTANISKWKGCGCLSLFQWQHTSQQALIDPDFQHHVTG